MSKRAMEVLVVAMLSPFCDDLLFATLVQVPPSPMASAKSSRYTGNCLACCLRTAGSAKRKHISKF